MNSNAFELVNPIMLALDVDDTDIALDLCKKLSGKLGAIKVGPRLVVSYGSELIERLRRFAPVFVDNKYLDIPNTMEAAVRATFEAGATFTTIHAWAGIEALERLAKVEEELNKERPFKILVVTVLTSFNDETLPPGLEKKSMADRVGQLADLALLSGLTGIVCSPQEVAMLRARSQDAFLVTPGVRMPTDAAGDQKRVETPETAIRQGASALVVGRPIYEAQDPVAALEKILASIKGAKA